MRRPSLLLIAALLAVALALAACGESGGSSGDSTPASTPATTAAQTPRPSVPSAPGQATVAWQYDIGDSVYGLVAADASGVFVGTGTIFTSAGGSLIHLDPANGQKRWSVDFTCPAFYPVLDANTVYIPCGDGTITAYDRASGQQKWRTQTGLAAFQPVIGDGLLFVDSVDPDGKAQLGVDTANMNASGVLALDLATGAEKWRVDVRAGGGSSGFPSYLTYAGGSLFVLSGGSTLSGSLLALDPATGTQEWRQQVDGANGRPQLVDGHLYVPANALQSRNPATGDVEWTASRGSASFAVAGGSIVGLSGAGLGAAFALDASTGNLRWTLDYCDCPFWPVAIGANVLVTGNTVAAIDPTTRQPAWTPPAGLVSDLPAVVVGSTAYLGNSRDPIIALKFPP